jgi:hypothetical protein
MVVFELVVWGDNRLVVGVLSRRQKREVYSASFVEYSFS